MKIPVHWYPKSSIEIQVVPWTPPENLQLTCEVERVWESESKKRTLYDKPVFCLFSHQENVIIGGYVSYKYVLAQLKNNVLFSMLHVYPLGVSGVVRYQDRVLMGKRSYSVTQYKGYLECVPSGSLDYGISPKEQIIHELHEETAIVESDLDKITLLGLFYSVSSRTFDLGYEIYLKTQKNVDASKEYSSIQWIEDSSMRQMCLAHSRIVPLSRCLLQSRRTS